MTGWLVLIVAVALAGCLGAPAGTEPPQGSGGPLPPLPAGPIPAGVDRCAEGEFFLFRPLAEVQALLPPGFVAREPSLLPVQAPSHGLGFLAVAAYDCKVSALDGTGGFVFLVTSVEPPAVDAPGVPASPNDFYEFARYAEGPREAGLLVGWGVAAAQGNLEVELTMVPGAPPGTGRTVVSDDAGVVLDFTVHAPLVQSSPPHTRRDWHLGPHGPMVTFVDVPDTIPYAVGSVASCTLRPGSLFHDVLGAEDCGRPDAGAILAPYGWHREFWFLGAQPGSGSGEGAPQPAPASGT